jgi:hypothetical protein
MQNNSKPYGYFRQVISSYIFEFLGGYGPSKSGVESCLHGNRKQFSESKQLDQRTQKCVIISSPGTETEHGQADFAKCG